MSEHEAVVVGAGPGGLAVGAELRRAGVPAVLVERADSVASSWRGRYDRLRLNTSRWTSKLPRARYDRGTPLFPSRDEVVAYFEDYAARNELDIRLGTEVRRIDRVEDRLAVRTSSGDLTARHVVVATGHEHTPVIPAWPGAERFGGTVLHAAEYRNPEPFRGRDVLVVGPGCSGVEIAYDLAGGGAARVRLAVRTPPTFLLRAQGGLPGDIPAMALLKLPTRMADAQARFVSRMSVGNLTDHGLPAPEVGAMTRLKREGKAPTIVDKEMIDAIRDGRIEVVAGLAAFSEAGVELVDGSRVEPDVVIAATGYSTGLEPMVGHLGVLDDRGVPRVVGGHEAAPGVRFVGYVPRPGQIGAMGAEARRAARGIARARVAATA
jgi:cation diffusion facilitator CzcD-associated flavoprotein CzcO